MTKFAIGSTVEWKSQSQGSATVKRGTVTDVIPPKAELRDVMTGLRLACFLTGAGPGLPRDHESYIVHVASKTGKGQGKLYWPRVSGLRLADQSEERGA